MVRLGFPKEMPICAWMPAVVAKMSFGGGKGFGRLVLQHCATILCTWLGRGVINSFVMFTSLVNVKFTKSRMRWRGGPLETGTGTESMYTSLLEIERYQLGV